MDLADKVRFDAHGLIPAVIFDADEKRVLTLCYMNKEALAKTLATGEVHVFRRSKGRLAKKGEISGHTQKVKDIFVGCHDNSLVVAVRQKVAACAEGYRSCFYRRWNQESGSLEVVEPLVFDPRQIYR